MVVFRVVLCAMAIIKAQPFRWRRHTFERMKRTLTDRQNQKHADWSSSRQNVFDRLIFYEPNSKYVKVCGSAAHKKFSRNFTDYRNKMKSKQNKTKNPAECRSTEHFDSGHTFSGNLFGTLSLFAMILRSNFLRSLFFFSSEQSIYFAYLTCGNELIVPL